MALPGNNSGGTAKKRTRGMGGGTSVAKGGKQAALTATAKRVASAKPLSILNPLGTKDPLKTADRLIAGKGVAKPKRTYADDQRKAPVKKLSSVKSPSKGADPASRPAAKPAARTSTPRTGGSSAPTKTATKAPAKAPAKSVASGTKTEAAASAKTLADYIKDATGLLGAGTDYSGLKNQLTADTGAADSKIAAMYEALQRGVISSGDRIKQAYADTADSQTAAAADATKTINDGYNAGAQQVTDRLSALGIGDAAKTLAANGSRAQDDQAAATAGVSSRLANTLGITGARSATAREMNENTGTAAQFAGVEQRSALQQQLIDGRAKLDQQQSASDADRRDKATQYALQQQSADATAANAAQEFALKAKQAAFDMSYKSGLLGVQQSKAATDASYKSGTLKLNTSKAATAAAHQAAQDTQAAINENGRNARDADKLKLASQQYQLGVQKLKDSNTNSLRNRQNAAKTAAINAGIRDQKQINNIVKSVK